MGRAIERLLVQHEVIKQAAVPIGKAGKGKAKG
jgi:hypothetical protein